MARNPKNKRFPSKSLIPAVKGCRPLAVVDEKQLEDLASINCTIEEIAAVSKVSHETIYSRFSEIVKNGRLRGNQSIKSKLFEKAMGGDTSALIWISKNQCGYRDKPPEEATMIQFNVYVNEVPK